MNRNTANSTKFSKITKSNNPDYMTLMQHFFIIIILGYFGIKIVYGMFFKFYPYKYYYKNITINTTEKTPDGNKAVTKNIAVNAYIPGMWNNEMTDFVSTIILSLIVLMMTYKYCYTMLISDKSLSMLFLVAYIVGLGYPVINNVFYNNSMKFQFDEGNWLCSMNFFYLVFLFAFLAVIIYLTSTSDEIKTKSSYIIYVVVMFLLLFGLILSKKNGNSYQAVTYNNQELNNCNTTSSATITSSGDVVNITFPFFAFIVLLLFCHEPSQMKQFTTLIYGLLLGVFVSGISYFGIEYFLVKMPTSEYMSLAKCSNINPADLTPSSGTNPIRNSDSACPSSKPDTNPANNPVVTSSSDSPVSPATIATDSKKTTKTIIKAVLMLMIICIVIFLAYKFMKGI